MKAAIYDWWQLYTGLLFIIPFMHIYFIIFIF